MFEHSEDESVLDLDAITLKLELDKEKDARLLIQDLLEEKSQQLNEATKEIEQVLSGSIKILTYVLALARPELFQKAAKVQRWAKSLAVKLNVERPWELDLAAMLYPLGVVGLPDVLALKYTLGKSLSDKERYQINQSTQTVYKLINNIDRMKGVASAIRYSRKNFDGSGFPLDMVSGKDIPQNARILKVLIDLADASTGSNVSRSDGFMKMASHKNEYDLGILKICYIELLENKTEHKKNSIQLSLLPNSLQEGDIVIKDIIDVDNKLLLASGLELSEMSIERIHVLSNNKRLLGKVKILRKTPKTTSSNLNTSQNNLAKDAH